MDESPSIEVIQKLPVYLPMPPAPSPVPGIVLSIIGIVFAAFCIWLGVRIYNRRERWAKRTLAAVTCVPALYALSIGPAAWILHALGEPPLASAIYRGIYHPINFVYRHGPQLARNLLDWYTSLL